MTEHETQATEPVVEEQSASSTAGSTASAPRTAGRFPVGRILVVALLLGVGVASPGLGVLTLPFATALLALGLLHGARTSFVLVAGVAAAGVAGAIVLGDSSVDPVWGGVALIAVGAFALLGLEQRRSMRPDPGAERGATSAGAAWPEPRIDRGISHAVLTWGVGAVLLVGLVGVVAGNDGLRDGARAGVREAYASYVVECRDGGVFAKQDELCDSMREQRDQFLGFADDHAPSLMAFLAAIFVVGGAGTSHMIVVARARALAKQGLDVDVRPSYRLRDLELHWSFAYIGVAAVVAWFAGDAARGALAEWLLAASVGLGAITAFVLLAQGAGLLAWVFTRRRMPLWYRVLLIVCALLVLPGAVAVTAAFGILDMGAHPRRRAAAKAAA